MHLLFVIIVVLFVILLCRPSIDNSSSSTPGPPDISSQGNQLQKKVGSNITLPCIYTANPTVRITKWHFLELMNTTSTFIFMGDTSGHYSVGTYSLTVYNLTAADGGLYTCNVTNQCGNDRTSYHVVIIGNYCNLWPLMSSVSQWSRNGGGGGQGAVPPPNNQAPCYSIYYTTSCRWWSYLRLEAVPIWAHMVQRNEWRQALIFWQIQLTN